MDNTTLVIVLTFVLLILALILLPAASFIRLVELIRRNGSQVEAVHQAVQRVQTTLLNGKGQDGSFNPTPDTPITQESHSSPTISNIEETEYRKSS